MVKIFSITATLLRAALCAQAPTCSVSCAQQAQCSRGTSDPEHFSCKIHGSTWRTQQQLLTHCLRLMTNLPFILKLPLGRSKGTKPGHFREAQACSTAHAYSKTDLTAENTELGSFGLAASSPVISTLCAAQNWPVCPEVGWQSGTEAGWVCSWSLQNAEKLLSSHVFNAFLLHTLEQNDLCTVERNSNW